MSGNRREHYGTKRWLFASAILLFIANAGWQSDALAQSQSNTQAHAQQTRNSQQSIARETIRRYYVLWVKVSGEVAKPGKILFDKLTMMLSEAVTAAGGVTAIARKKGYLLT